MKSLHDLGFSVSAGVLNILDSDFESASDLHIPIVAEGPFTQIGDESHANNMRMIDESAMVVVSRFPVGPGNFKNLEAARYALEKSKRVFVMTGPPEPSVDFIGGKADSYIAALISSGAVPVSALEALVSEMSGGMRE